MWSYLVRRILWTIPITLSVVLFTFTMFTLVASDPARSYAGKMATDADLVAIRHRMGIDKPVWLNIRHARLTGSVAAAFDSQFFDTLLFRFPESMRYQESVWSLMKSKAPVSFSIQFPVFVIELGMQIIASLWCARHRGRMGDLAVTFLCVLGMSVPALSIYMVAQWLLAVKWQLFPIAGWDSGLAAVHFMAMPILVSVICRMGAGTRFYRTVVLEEMGADYVRTAKSKGVGTSGIYLTHVMRNVMIPILTRTVTALPTLFLGALFLERLFQIPGVGSLLVESIFNNDRPVVMVVTYAMSVSYCMALLLTDICYTIADPRVRLR